MHATISVILPVLGYSIPFFFFFSFYFSLCISVWDVSVDIKAHEFFVSWLLTTSPLVNWWMLFFIFVKMFLTSNIFFWFLEFQYFHFHYSSFLPSCPFFPLEPLPLLIMVILIPSLINSKIFAISDSSSVTCFVSPDYVFFLPFSRPYNLLKTRHNVFIG